MILCVNLNPCVDKTLYLDSLVHGVIQAADGVGITVGGKANNVARVLKAFGFDAVAMNFLGGETGRLCERYLAGEDGLVAETVWTKAPTREIITIYEKEPNRHTDIKEPSGEILPGERAEFVERYEALLGSAEMVAFGGSAPSKSVDDLPGVLCRLARERDVPFILDTSGEALALAVGERPFMVKPNLAEAEALFGVKIKTGEDELAALERLAAKAELALLSMGRRGFLAAFQEGRWRVEPPGHDAPYNARIRGDVVPPARLHEREVAALRGDFQEGRWRVEPPKVFEKNNVGSGDALVAGVIMGLLGGKPFEETLSLAAAAAAANASVVEACRVAPAEVEVLVPLVRVKAI